MDKSSAFVILMHHNAFFMHNLEAQDFLKSIYATSLLFTFALPIVQQCNQRLVLLFRSYWSQTYSQACFLGSSRRHAWIDKPEHWLIPPTSGTLYGARHAVFAIGQVARLTFHASCSSGLTMTIRSYISATFAKLEIIQTTISDMYPITVTTWECR